MHHVLTSVCSHDPFNSNQESFTNFGFCTPSNLSTHGNCDQQYHFKAKSRHPRSPKITKPWHLWWNSLSRISERVISVLIISVSSVFPAAVIVAQLYSRHGVIS